MGLLDLIPTVVTAGIILKTMDVVFDKPRPVSIHERALKKKYKKKIKRVI